MTETASGNTTTWTYDYRGRVASETKTLASLTFRTDYAYRPDDQPVRLTYPDGETVTTRYNAQGRPDALANTGDEFSGVPLTTYISQASYNPIGQALTITDGAGVVTQYGYHPLTQRLTSLTAPGKLNLTYEYDPAGSVKTITDSGAQAVFAYDAFDRLKTASGAFTASYNYSDIGNLQTRQEAGAPLTLTYPAVGVRPAHAPQQVAGVMQQYDANGNLVNDGRRAFTYDAANRLTQVISGTLTTRFTYDGDGQLVMRETAAGRTLYIGPHFEAFLPASPTPPPQPTPKPGLRPRVWLPAIWSALVSDGPTLRLTKHYLFNGQRIAQRSGREAPVYLYRDHLGSTTATSAAETARYWPYGALRSGSMSGTAYRFTGQRFDADLGLYWVGARWYDPQRGQWLQPDTIVPDPLRPQTLNRYAYGNNSPLTYIDSDGHFAFIPLLVIGGIALLKVID